MTIRVVLITKEKAIEKRFAAIRRSKTFDFEARPEIPNRRELESVEIPTLLYLDVALITESRRLLKLENEHLRIGFVDSKLVVPDTAELFHRGAVDYLGPELLKSELATQRIKSAAEFRPFEAPPEPVPAKPSQSAALGSDWQRIRTGREYLFVLLYIEIDLIDEWKKKSGKTHLDEVMESFHKHVKRIVAPVDGRVWMWMNSGGLVLIPFDGESCPTVERCMKVILDRIIISAEYYTYNTIITYRMALHIGSTLYESRGNTGKIVSDTVNFMFHLGQKYLKPQNLFLTETIVPFLPEGLRDCFTDAGTFEGVGIHRMKLPIGLEQRAVTE